MAPRVALPDLAVIPPTVVTGVLDVGRREGLPVRSWVAGTGLEPALLDRRDARVSYRQAETVLVRALRDLPDRPLGMEVGGRDALLSFGLLGIAMRSSATVDEALEVGLDLHRASGSLLDVEREDLGGEMALRFHQRWPSPGLRAFLCEEALASITVFTRSMLGDSWTPARLDLGYRRPPYAARYQRFFRCPIRFDADADRLVLPAGQGNRPLPTSSAPTRAAAVEECRRLLSAEGAQPDVVASIESLLGAGLRRPPTMAEVAEQLHVTERTLRRRLTEAGERFSDVRDRVRERHASLLLGRSTLSVAQVAAEVGFTDAREFRRAYLRWTGRTPSQTRREAAQPDPSSSPSSPRR